MGNSRLASYVWYFSFLCQIIYVHNCSSAIWLQLKMCCSLIMKALIWSHTWNRSVFNVSLHAFVGPWYKKRAMLCQNLSRNVHFNNNFSKWNENMAERYLIILELKNLVFTMSIEWQCEAFSPFYHTLLGLPWQRGNGREEGNSKVAGAQASIHSSKWQNSLWHKCVWHCPSPLETGGGVRAIGKNPRKKWKLSKDMVTLFKCTKDLQIWKKNLKNPFLHVHW